MAAPCSDCGTTGGMIPPKCHRPGRVHGRCLRCHFRQRYQPVVLLEDRSEPEPEDPTPQEIETACQKFRTNHFRTPVGQNARLHPFHRIGGGR